jgi:hypothetical protein
MKQENLIEVKRYLSERGKLTRYWAVYVDGELLAVVLYRKGALAIKERISAGSTQEIKLPSSPLS